MDKGADSYLRFLQGDNEGFVEIIEEYKDGLLLFLDSFIRDHHIAEEAADETFLKLYVSKPRFKTGHSFKTWLYTIGKNTAVDYLRKLKNHRLVPIEDYYYMCDETDIEADYIRSEEDRELRRAVSRLSPDHAQVLHLVFFEGLTNTEAARIMGKSNRQISDLIYRAKKALKALLDAENTDNANSTEKGVEK